MEEPRLTKNLYEYLTKLCEDKNITLHSVAKAAGVNHQIIYGWKERTPRTFLIVDKLLKEIEKAPILDDDILS